MFVIKIQILKFKFIYRINTFFVLFFDRHSHNTCSLGVLIAGNTKEQMRTSYTCVFVIIERSEGLQLRVKTV